MGRADERFTWPMPPASEQTLAASATGSRETGLPQRATSRYKQEKPDPTEADPIMKRFKSILTSIDARAEDHPALQWAETLAEHNGASLKIVDVLPCVAWPWRVATPDYEHVQELLESERQGLLDTLAQPIRAKGIPVTTKVLRGHSSAEIIQEVVTHHHDLVIRRPKGTLSRRPGYFGSTSINLMRNCPCPVWVVKHAAPRFRKVLAAIDPAPRDSEHEALNKTIMDLTLSICEREQAEPLVVHVWNLYGESIFRGRMSEAEFEEFEESARVSVEESFTQFLEP